MKRFIKTAAMATTSCALVLSGAGLASASGEGHNGHNGRHGHHRHHYHGRHIERYDHRGFYGHHGGANAYGVAANSPGILSGNLIQVPINIPINVCGNTINVPGLLNPAFGNICINK
ncbi:MULTISPECIES: chaplin [Streptomyces]|uniref:Chaplin n=1 Tax=Streptomyces siderophoricus TaxID=2802281 RepID=A0ABS1MXR2_9ACTN|nr:chaplin [Streptomyces sp. 9-7]MBL1092515.1 chaplin [Streptomyces sp. 9-7]